jgi:hypothetical protein
MSKLSEVLVYRDGMIDIVSDPTEEEMQSGGVIQFDELLESFSREDLIHIKKWIEVTLTFPETT